MKIYELQNTGKGVINSISLSDLLLIYSDEIPNLDSVIESNVAKLNNQHNIEVFGGINWRSYSVGNTEYTGQELTPHVYETIPFKPLYRIGTGIGNTTTEQSLSFFSTKTIYKDSKYSKGLEYDGDYESNFTDKSLVTKKFVKDSLENLQKVITYPTDFTGTNYTLTNADNNYEIIIDNGATAVTITVPSGLTSKIGVGFTQKGSGDVTYITSGTTINNPIGLKIKGQFHQTYLSQELSTNNYFLGGSTKI